VRSPVAVKVTGLVDADFSGLPDVVPPEPDEGVVGEAGAPGVVGTVVEEDALPQAMSMDAVRPRDPIRNRRRFWE
jgi:hypothetical protein